MDDYLRVKGYEGSIWAIGDAAISEKHANFFVNKKSAKSNGVDTDSIKKKIINNIWFSPQNASYDPKQHEQQFI